jgi:hypothetical protein
MNNLTFDPIKHQYMLDGVILPSVTQVLKGVGIIDFSNIPPSRLEAACKFGTAVHKATELWDKGTLDEVVLDPHLKPYLDGWKLFRKETGFNPIAIEEPLYSKIYRVAGTPDRLGQWNINTPFVIPDIKTTFELSPANAIQLAGYELMWKEFDKGADIKAKYIRISVLLNDKGTYKIEEYKDKNDTNIFIAALSVYNWKGKNGK